MDILQNRNATDITVIQGVIDNWISYRTEMPQISLLYRGSLITGYPTEQTEMPHIPQLYRGSLII